MNLSNTDALVADFLDSFDNINYFLTPEIIKVYNSSSNFESVIITSTKNNKIQGLLLAAISRNYSGPIGALTSRSIIWGGVLTKDKDVGVIDKILKEYIIKVKGRVVYSQVRCDYPLNVEERDAYIRNGFSYEPHLNILIDLRKGEQKLWNEVHSSRRKMIRRSVKSGTTVIQDNSSNALEISYRLLKSLYKRLRLPLPKYDLFYNLLQISTPRKGLKIFLAKFGDQIIGCRLVLVHKSIIYDFFAASDEKYLDKQPNDILPWEILVWGQNQGYKTFDFGGAGKVGVNYGVRDYKLRFGGELIETGRFEYIHNNQLMALGRLGLKVYQALPPLNIRKNK